MEVERKNRKRTRAGAPPLTPIYTADEATECTQYFQGIEYNQTIQLFPGIEVIYHDAGHILGSAMIEVRVTEGDKLYKIVFSGDIGNKNQPFIQDPSCVPDMEYIVMESTYGDRLHEDTSDRMERLKNIINATYNRGGNLVIPSFAIERTQDLLYYINLLNDSKQIPPINVYVDSPLAVAATGIFEKSLPYFDDETRELIRKGENPFNLPRLHLTQSVQESIGLNEVSRSIIISASGMADAGRIKHHLKHNLWRPEATVLFVGYQAEGTLGRRLVEGEKQVTIHGEEIAVKAHIENIDGFSAHADQQGLLEWVACTGAKAKGIILIHGEPEAQAVLAEKIKAQSGIEPMIPVLGETFEWVDTGIKRIAPSPEMIAEDEALTREHPTVSQNTRQTQQPQLKRHQPTHAEVNKALMKLRGRIKDMMAKDQHEQDMNAVLEDLQAMTDLVETKIHHGRQK